MLKKILIIAAGLVVLLLSAPAGAQYGEVFSGTVSNTNPQPGETITFEGVCPFAEVVDVSIDGEHITTIPVNEDDTFSGPVTVPSDLAPGTHTLTATCGSEVLSITLTIGSPGGSGPLADTGASNTGLLLKLGGGLVLLGAVVALFATKRRQATA